MFSQDNRRERLSTILIIFISCVILGILIGGLRNRINIFNILFIILILIFIFYYVKHQTKRDITILKDKIIVLDRRSLRANKKVIPLSSISSFDVSIGNFESRPFQYFIIIYWNGNIEYLFFPYSIFPILSNMRSTVIADQFSELLTYT